MLASRNWGGYPFPNRIADDFAQKFARYHGAKYGLAVANGTIAIEIALKAAGIKPGDEVIVPACAWEVTAGPVLLLNAVPVFTDDIADAALKVCANIEELRGLKHLAIEVKAMGRGERPRVEERQW